MKGFASAVLKEAIRPYRPDEDTSYQLNQRAAKIAADLPKDRAAGLFILARVASIYALMQEAGQNDSDAN